MGNVGKVGKIPVILTAGQVMTVAEQQYALVGVKRRYNAVGGLETVSGTGQLRNVS